MTLISIQDLVSPERHIFLSPHYDDISLAAGGTARQLASNGRQPEIALIFGDHPDPNLPLTPFARELHQRWGLSATEAVYARRAEEAAASSLIGATDRYLPFHDAIYRGDRYLSDDDLFGTPTPDESSLPALILASLDVGDTNPGSTRFYAPLAIGNHVDHQHAFLVGVKLHQDGHQVWFYEDLPYALIPGKLEARLSVASPAVEVAALVDVSSVWNTKIDAIMAYPSQLDVIFGGYANLGTTRSDIDAAMRQQSESLGDGVAAERFWIVATS
ncbi:PIG-L family deacetylase [soil metagenome]